MEPSAGNSRFSNMLGVAGKLAQPLSKESENRCHRFWW
jgi:hypothetical protein